SRYEYRRSRQTKISSPASAERSTDGSSTGKEAVTTHHQEDEDDADRREPPIERADLEAGERAGRAGEPSGDHGLVDLLGEGVGLAEQGARTRRDEPPPLADIALVVADAARLPRRVHVGHRVEQQEQVPVRHPDDEDEDLRNEQGAQRGE